MARQADTLNRLRDLDVDSFDRDSQSHNSVASSSLSARLGRPRTTKNAAESAYMRRTNPNPFTIDTVSEINDEKEKNTIFHHTLKHGLFNDIR